MKIKMGTVCDLGRICKVALNLPKEDGKIVTIWTDRSSHVLNNKTVYVYHDATIDENNKEKLCSFMQKEYEEVTKLEIDALNERKSFVLITPALAEKLGVEKINGNYPLYVLNDEDYTKREQYGQVYAITLNRNPLIPDSANVVAQSVLLTARVKRENI